MQGKYSLELKRQIVSEYKPYAFRYKRLAKKFGLKRDTVFYIIKSMKNNTNAKQPMSATEKTFNGKSFEELDKNDFLDLLAGYAWFKTYSGNLEKNVSDEVKKLQEAVDAKVVYRCVVL